MTQATIDLITDAADFTLIIAGMGVILVAVALVLVAARGGKMLLAAIRG